MEIIKSCPIDYSGYHYTRKITITFYIKSIFQSQYNLTFIRELEQHKQNKSKETPTNRKPLVRHAISLVVYQHHQRKT